MISFRKEYVIRILQKIRWQQNSSRILIRILVGNFSGKYIWWLKNSSRISIRILVGNAADCRIPMEFWLEFQLIINGAKSADCVWLQIVTYVSTQVIKLRFGVERTNGRTDERTDRGGYRSPSAGTSGLKMLLSKKPMEF